MWLILLHRTHSLVMATHIRSCPADWTYFAPLYNFRPMFG